MPCRVRQASVDEGRYDANAAAQFDYRRVRLEPSPQQVQLGPLVTPTHQPGPDRARNFWMGHVEAATVDANPITGQLDEQAEDRMISVPPLADVVGKGLSSPVHRVGEPSPGTHAPSRREESSEFGKTPACVARAHDASPGRPVAHLALAPEAKPLPVVPQPQGAGLTYASMAVQRPEG